MVKLVNFFATKVKKECKKALWQITNIVKIFNAPPSCQPNGGQLGHMAVL